MSPAVFGPDGKGKKWYPSPEERERVRGEDRIRQEWKERDKKNRTRYSKNGDLKAEYRKRQAERLADRLPSVTQSDVCPARTARPRLPDDGPEASGTNRRKRTGKKALGYLGVIGDIWGIIEYPVKGLYYGRNPFEIWGEEIDQEWDDFQRRPVIIDPFGGFIGPNPYYDHHNGQPPVT